MNKHPKFLRLFLFGLVLWLLLVPTSVGGQGQDIPDGSAEAEAVEVPDIPEELTSPDQEEATIVDQSALTNRAFLPIIQGGNQSGQAVTDETVSDPLVQAANFDQLWVQEPCSGVAQGDRGLWDDIPAGTTNNEAGLIWFITNDIGDETCSHSSATNNLATGAGAINQLRFRVAVNDSARFSVSIYRLVGGVCSNVVWVHKNTSATQDDNQFRTFSKSIPAGSTICSVQITLTDDPDGIDILTSSALIDYIQLRDSVLGTVFWEEGF